MRTKTRDLRGIIVLDGEFALVTVTIRASRDEIGQSISLAVEDMDLMIQIPVEPVKDILEVKA